MSIHGDNPLSPERIQQTQNVSPADIRERARHLGQEMKDIIERAQHLTLEPMGMQQAPLAFLASLPPAELETEAAAMPAAQGSLPSDSVSELTAFFGQNSKTFANILGIRPPVRDAIQQFPTLSPRLQSAVSALEVAILVDTINAEQAQTGAKLGIISAQTAGDVEKTQLASAASQYASGMSQAQQSKQQAAAEITSGVISTAVGVVSAGLTIGSMSALTKAATLESTAKTATSTAEVGGVPGSLTKAASALSKDAKAATAATRPAAEEEEGIEMTTMKPKEAIPKPGEAAEAESGTTAEAKPTKTPEQEKADADAKAAREKQVEEEAELRKAQANAWKNLGDRLEKASSMVNTIGGGAATWARGQINYATYTEQVQATEQKQAADLQTAQAQYVNQFMDSSNTAAKTSMDNAAQTAQASLSIKQAASQAASSIFRG